MHTMSNSARSRIAGQKIEIQAKPRTIIGRQVKTLRKKGFVPAVIYGNNFEALNIQVFTKDFQKVYAEAGESTLVYVNLDKETYPTIIHDVATDSVSDDVLHVDFYKVRLDEKIKAKIPVVIIGESPAVKGLGGILVRNINEIEVEGFPQDLPHEFEVDISSLAQFRDHVQIKDLKVPKNVEIQAGADEIIALIQEPISEAKLKESLETGTASVDDIEVIKKEKAEAEPAEGETAPAEPAKETPKK